MFVNRAIFYFVAHPIHVMMQIKYKNAKHKKEKDRKIVNTTSCGL